VARLSTKQDKLAMMEAHVNAFDFFGATPQVMVYDNMRTTVRVQVESRKAGHGGDARYATFLGNVVSLAFIFETGDDLVSLLFQHEHRLAVSLAEINFLRHAIRHDLDIGLHEVVDGRIRCEDVIRVLDHLRFSQSRGYGAGLRGCGSGKRLRCGILLYMATGSGQKKRCRHCGRGRVPRSFLEPDVIGKKKCSDFGTMKCSKIGNNAAVRAKVVFLLQ